MTIGRLVRVGLLLAVCQAASVAGAQVPSVARAGGDVPGTYEIRICHASGCGRGDTTGAVVRGLIVLDSADLRVTANSPEEARGFALAGYGYDIAPSKPANLCYVLARGVAITRGLAGIAEHGRSVWHRPAAGPAADSGIILFSLYESSDAWYEVGAAVRNGRLEGIAQSSGSGAMAHSLQERIFGTRIGPPRPGLTRRACNCHIPGRA
jgi:hypothetical protein